ncbi:dehydrogenase E1 component family protein [Toxoplasma gondii GAB2-2007-GAL-DOM2]|uniref:2-oxoisovalerate dehydrogenase subunit alpha n=10 Tax=Toxoplasma gondii TaxID=5811 RepID=S7W6J0_TOXGG|nr:dehydrogenase E1 component family protein [Toxoplasma gondii GT1]KFG39644.1 dehydrogenase E1 component family protein [Toxoplasma gondii GAB2-2007-GAL-DOM2]
MQFFAPASIEGGSASSVVSSCVLPRRRSTWTFLFSRCSSSPNNTFFALVSALSCEGSVDRPSEPTSCFDFSPASRVFTRRRPSVLVSRFLLPCKLIPFFLDTSTPAQKMAHTASSFFRRLLQPAGASRLFSAPVVGRHPVSLLKSSSVYAQKSASRLFSAGVRTFSSAAAGPREEAYHAGLIHTQFTTDMNISNETPVIPIFRILDYDGQIADGWQCPMTNDEVLEAYQFMVKLSIWDNMFYSVQRQGRISFYIQNQGEEALQTAVGLALDKKDHLFCQYRELGVLMLHGFTAEDALEQLFARRGDESKGRQMPISYSKHSVNLHTICTPLTTQVPHAAGAGYAFKLAGDDRIAVAFFGEGAASEGDFHAAMNFAATLKSQTLFVCRNNGYAISTPVKDQYAGDGIAIRGISYGMHTIRVDGNDLFASLLATKKAREIIVSQRQPVLIEFMTYRVGHHSTSDDSFQYRPSGELEAWGQSGIHPIARVRRYLDNLNLWSDKQDEELRKDARATMLRMMKVVEKDKRSAVIGGIFDDVYDKEPWNLREQRESLKAFMEKNKQHYPQLKEYESL